MTLCQAYGHLKSEMKTVRQLAASNNTPQKGKFNRVKSFTSKFAKLTVEIIPSSKIITSCCPVRGRLECCYLRALGGTSTVIDHSPDGFYATALIDGFKIDFLIDTGAEITVIPDNNNYGVTCVLLYICH